MRHLPTSVRRIPLRLAIVVLLSLLVAGAFYGVSLTPISQAMVGTRGGPPGGRGPAAAANMRSVAPDAGASAPIDAATAQAAPPNRPQRGGGRPASLSRGLPETARNVGVIAVLILVVSGVQAWLRIRARARPRRLTA